jgi:ribosomal protein L9
MMDDRTKKTIEHGKEIFDLESEYEMPVNLLKTIDVQCESIKDISASMNYVFATIEECDISMILDQLESGEILDSLTHNEIIEYLEKHGYEVKRKSGVSNE